MCELALKILDKLDNSKRAQFSNYDTDMLPGSYPENIWFLWSKTAYSGDERRCHYAGRTNDERRTTEDRATQPMEAGG